MEEMASIKSTSVCFPSDGMSRHILRTPVNITLRRFARGSDAVSASWNFSLVGGHGGWQSDGCRILNHSANFTTISCNSLGNYGLLMVGFNIPCFVCMKWSGNFNYGVQGALQLALWVVCRYYNCNCLNWGLITLSALQDLNSGEDVPPSIQPLHPVIYATIIILLLCLLTIIISYIYHHR